MKAEPEPFVICNVHEQLSLEHYLRADMKLIPPFLAFSALDCH
jgi:hypothetical protein